MRKEAEGEDDQREEKAGTGGMEIINCRFFQCIHYIAVILYHTLHILVDILGSILL